MAGSTFGNMSGADTVDGLPLKERAVVRMFLNADAMLAMVKDRGGGRDRERR